MYDKEQQLIAQIESFFLLTNHTCHLIFDGKSKDFNHRSKFLKGQISVVFTDAFQTADEYIIHFVETSLHCDAIKLVTSDKGIWQKCKQKKIKMIDSVAFLKHIAFIQHQQHCLLQQNHVKPQVISDVDYWLNQFQSS